MSILIAILILGLIIFLHEFGHFVSAKFFKMPVSEFSVGMGAQVCAVETEETTYSIRAIPIGGYVNIEGMEIGSDVKNGFSTKPAYQRFIVLFAGVFMNFFTAFIILFLSVKLNGVVEYNQEAYIGAVNQESVNKGLIFPKDKILEIEGKKINFWADIPQEIEKINKKEKEENKINIKILRNNEEKNVELKLKKDESGRYLLGISPLLKKKNVSFFEGLKLAKDNFKNIFMDTLTGFGMLFGGKANLEDVSGPVGIFKVVGEISKQGFIPILAIFTILSVNIGILNLLPIPALDGGRIIFVLLEFVGIRINKKLEEKLHKIGMALLLFVIIFISTNDILKLFR